MIYAFDRKTEYLATKVNLPGLSTAEAVDLLDCVDDSYAVAHAWPITPRVRQAVLRHGDSSAIEAALAQYDCFLEHEQD